MIEKVYAIYLHLRFLGESETGADLSIAFDAVLKE